MNNQVPEPCQGTATAEHFFQEYHKYLGRLLDNLDYKNDNQGKYDKKQGIYSYAVIRTVAEADLLDKCTIY